MIQFTLILFFACSVGLAQNEKPKADVVAQDSKMKNLSNTGTITIPAPIPPKVPAQSAVSFMEVPKSLDLAMGEFKINEAVCKLNHAYSTVSNDPFGEQKSRYEILISSKPISAKIFNVVETFESILPKDQCWIYVEIENSQSLNPIRAFIPGQPPVNYSAARQPFLRKQMDLEQDVLGATVVFKDPMISGEIKVTGQFSLRTHFRQLTQSPYLVFSKGAYVDKPTNPVFVAYSSTNTPDKSRNIASVPESFPALDPAAVAASQKLLPPQMEFQHAFINNKAKKAVLVLQGNYTAEQMASGMMAVKPDPRYSDSKIYGMIVMDLKDGHWVTTQEKWLANLPNWAVSRRPPEEAKAPPVVIDRTKAIVIPGIADSPPKNQQAAPQNGMNYGQDPNRIPSSSVPMPQPAQPSVPAPNTAAPPPPPTM